MDDHKNYKEMYLTLFKATEEALDKLITAQRTCEKLYLTADGPGSEAPEED